MQSKVPLPTDNIFKFYALFGLLMFLSTLFGFVQLHISHNELVFKLYVESETLNSEKELSKKGDALKLVLDKQMENAVADKDFFMSSIVVLLVFATYLMGYGFHRWHTIIQPRQDELLDRQIEKIELEIESIYSQMP